MLIDVVYTSGMRAQWQISIRAGESLEAKIEKLASRFVPFGLILQSWKVAPSQEIL